MQALYLVAAQQLSHSCAESPPLQCLQMFFVSKLRITGSETNGQQRHNIGASPATAQGTTVLTWYIEPVQVYIDPKLVAF